MSRPPPSTGGQPSASRPLPSSSSCKNHFEWFMYASTYKHAKGALVFPKILVWKLPFLYSMQRQLRLVLGWHPILANVGVSSQRQPLPRSLQLVPFHQHPRLKRRHLLLLLSPLPGHQQVWPLMQLYSVCFFVKKNQTFICLQGRPMIPQRGKGTILLFSSQYNLRPCAFWGTTAFDIFFCPGIFRSRNSFVIHWYDPRL